MTDISPTTTCVNCERSEAEAPLLAWRYQGRALWICSDCLPVLIHKREQLLGKVDAKGVRGETGDQPPPDPKGLGDF
jgi:hypothetical protein